MQEVQMKIMVIYGVGLWFIFRGSMLLGGAYPFALDVKGGEWAEDFEVAIKSKGGEKIVGQRLRTSI